MKVTLVVPTISGREDVLARVIAAYEATTAWYHVQLLTPKDFPCWSAAVNSVRDKIDGDYVHYGNPEFRLGGI